MIMMEEIFNMETAVEENFFIEFASGDTRGILRIYILQFAQSYFVMSVKIWRRV